MCAVDEFRAIMDSPGRTAWIDKMLAAATQIYRTRRRRYPRLSPDEQPIGLAEPQELVAEAMSRLEERQGERAKHPSFDEFFIDEMTKGADRHRYQATRRIPDKGLVLLVPKEDDFLKLEPDFRERQREAMTSLIAESRLRNGSATRRYASKLVDYVDWQFTTAQIALDLGVEENTVPSIRDRVRKLKRT